MMRAGRHGGMHGGMHHGGMHHGGMHHGGMHHGGMHHGGMHHGGMHHGGMHHGGGINGNRGAGFHRTAVGGIGNSEPVAGGVSLQGNNNPRCLSTYANLAYISADEQRLFSEDLLAKEFRDDGTVFLRFTVDDIEKSWSCLKDIPAWNQQPGMITAAMMAGGGGMVPGGFVLTSGVSGQVGAKYNCGNDTYEVIDIDEGNHEIEVRYKIFVREIEKSVKARIIRSSQANGNDSVVEFEFEQSIEDQKNRNPFQGAAALFFMPCFWPHFLLLFALLLVYLLAITPNIMLKKRRGMTPRPYGLFLRHSEATRLRGVFHSYTGRKNIEVGTTHAVDANVIDAVKVDAGYSEPPVGEPLGITESILPSGFGM